MFFENIFLLKFQLLALINRTAAIQHFAPKSNFFNNRILHIKITLKVSKSYI